MAQDAGVPVYLSSNNLAGLQEALNTAKVGEKKLRDVLGDKNASKEEKDRARSELARLGKLEAAQKSATAGIARQLDDAHVVIRADFDERDLMVRQFPGTFSVPSRYAKHMMVVADFRAGDAGAIEDALEAAWQLQQSAD